MLSTGWFQEKIINENLICPPPPPTDSTEQEHLALLLSTGWFQDQNCFFHNQPK